MKPKAVRIIDPYVLQQIEEERRRSGETTPTKTAARLIIERTAQLDRERQSESRREAAHPIVA